MSLAALQEDLAGAGFELTGALPASDYDRIVPEPWRTRHVHPTCQGTLIVGNAGRGLWPHFQASPEARLRRNPLDRYTRRIFEQVCASREPGARLAMYTDKRDETYLPLMALGQRTGFGVPSRLGLLVHPVYGPWVSIRGVLFLPYPVPFAEPAPFDPCPACPAPCARACHGQVVTADGVDPRACFRTKILKPACRAACDARSACCIGPEHAFSHEQIAHHSRIRWRASTARRALGVLIGR